MEVMNYSLTFSQTAIEELRYVRQHKPSLQAKIDRLIQELAEHPLTGTGKPEKLRYNLAGCLSRRINREDRLVYRINEEDKIVSIESLLGHY